MDFKKNEFKNYLLKFENIEIIYKSPKQHWGITNKGLKKRISISVFNEFLKIKKLISYEDSKKIKKGINFKILQNKIEIFSKKKKISINVISNFSNLSLLLNNQLDKNVKKEYGIFFTSSFLVKLILDQLKLILIRLNIKIKNVLEPSCGSGQFLFGLNEYFSGLNICGLELNKFIYNNIKQISFCNNNLIIKKKNFLNFFNDNFDLIIGNPPFRIIKKSLVINYNDFFSNKVNLYVLFLLHSLKLLKKNGLLVMVLPKSFLNSISYNSIRYYISINFKILLILDNFDNNFFLGTCVETFVLFLQKKKCNSKDFFVFFGKYLSFSNHFKYLNQILMEGKSLKDLGFNITVGTILKSKKKLYNSGTKGFFICDNNIQDNKIKLDFTSIIHSNFLYTESCIVVFRGYGNTKLNFKYALIDIKEGLLVKNHLLIIRQVGNISLIELIKKFKKKKTLDFINLYFNNQSLTKTDLELLPIF